MTYNLYRVLLVRFFKWLYYPEIEQDKQQKPPVIQNMPQLRRREQSIYKPADFWTEQDHLIFLRYRPNLRDRCYHAIARDSSCRVHEILRLKLKDIIFKSAQQEINDKYPQPVKKIMHDWEQSTIEAGHTIKPLTVEGQAILDPFMGYETFGVAALQLNRRFIGIEIDKEHYSMAAQRLSNFTVIM